MSRIGKPPCGPLQGSISLSCEGKEILSSAYSRQVVPAGIYGQLTNFVLIVRVLKSAFRSAEYDQLRNIDANETKVLRFINLVDTELQLDISTNVSSVQQLLKTLDAPITRLVNQAFLFEKTLNENKYVAILRWISSVPYVRHHQQYSEGRLPGTTEWLLQHPEYGSWMVSSTSSILLLHGILGSGKTTLTSAVVDDLLQRSSSQSLHYPVAYF